MAVIDLHILAPEVHVIIVVQILEAVAEVEDQEAEIDMIPITREEVIVEKNEDCVDLDPEPLPPNFPKEELTIEEINHIYLMKKPQVLKNILY